MSKDRIHTKMRDNDKMYHNTNTKKIQVSGKSIDII